MGYYTETLSASRLKQCYDIAPPRVKQYFEAEIDFVLKKIRRRDKVLDMGCGYGRLVPALAEKAKMVYGIDTSFQSLLMGKEMLTGFPNVMLLKMDAVKMTFDRNVFDMVLCLQNGISAFHVDQRELIKESIRVTKPGGKILFSSYSEKFWPQRLNWFILQSEAGLLGAIDSEKTQHGIIVCKDGFTATTMRPDQFIKLTRWIRGIRVSVEEVDDSCVFFIISKTGA